MSAVGYGRWRTLACWVESKGRWVRLARAYRRAGVWHWFFSRSCEYGLLARFFVVFEVSGLKADTDEVLAKAFTAQAFDEASASGWVAELSCFARHVVLPVCFDEVSQEDFFGEVYACA